MSDKLFHQVDDMQIILRRKGGVFIQAKVYTRYVDGKQHLFAGFRTRIWGDARHSQRCSHAVGKGVPADQCRLAG